MKNTVRDGYFFKYCKQKRKTEKKTKIRKKKIISLTQLTATTFPERNQSRFLLKISPFSTV